MNRKEYESCLKIYENNGNCDGVYCHMCVFNVEDTDCPNYAERMHALHWLIRWYEMEGIFYNEISVEVHESTVDIKRILSEFNLPITKNRVRHANELFETGECRDCDGCIFVNEHNHDCTPVIFSICGPTGYDKKYALKKTLECIENDG